MNDNHKIEGKAAANKGRLYLFGVVLSGACTAHEITVLLR